MSGPEQIAPPFSEQPRGSRLARLVLRLLGWKLRFDGVPGKQGVIVAYPHTSNWDFPILLLAKWAVGLQVRFWGKDSLFRVPLLGAWMRWLGGVPVVRSSSHGVVADMVSKFADACSQQQLFWLALSPEGTRSLTQGWRSGFYQVAVRAGVPLGVACLDVRNKHIDVSRFFRLTGNEALDIPAIALALRTANGFNPLQASPIRLISK